MANPAGMKILEEPKKRRNRPLPSPRHTKAPERERNPVWCHIIQENVGRDPPNSSCNPSVDLCKKSGTILNMPEELSVVNFIVFNVSGIFVMKLDLADPNFANFRSNSANVRICF